MKLIHYSSEPLGAPRSVPQSEAKAASMKSLGLWVSVEGEDDWPSWCRAEEFGLGQLVIENEVVLRPGANILHLKDEGEIRQFARRYGETCSYPGSRFVYSFINWRRVADEHQGIVIAPYCWALRLEDGFLWYYGWDCASGCIWDANAIAATVSIPHVVPTDNSENHRNPTPLGGET